MERPNSRGASNFIVGLFVFVAFLVCAGFIVFMGGTTTLSGEHEIKTVFKDVRGVNVGAPIFLSGIQVGRVSGFEFPADGNSEMGILTTLSLYKKYKSKVKEDSTATISTQGVLGDKVIVISPGSTSAKELPDGTLLTTQQPKEFMDFFAKGGGVVDSLSAAALSLNTLLNTLNEAGRMKNILANLEKTSHSLATATNGEEIAMTLKSLRSVMEKIDKGQGTLGALVNDSALHDDLRVLLGGAKRSQMVRFLIRQAISSADEKALAAEKAEKAGKLDDAEASTKRK